MQKKRLSWPVLDPKGRIIHGADYNPEQWRATPGIHDEDMRLMGLAGMNSATIGVFSWALLEPEEGRYDFSWMDDIVERLHKNDCTLVLATPSGARPAWMSQRYPEVLRVNEQGIRNLHGQRHNHCFTSPVYREKCVAMNTKLAERYGHHPALMLWHVSNEYGGECRCELCTQAFRDWLKERYHHSLDELNQAWWTAFWSHTYTDWDQIDPPSWRGETCVHGQNLDWKRFVTRQTIDFFRCESAPLRKITPDIPVTVNMMGLYAGLDYQEFAPHVDVISWDSYTAWHSTPDTDAPAADYTGFVHDMNRSLKGGQPFLLMESTPSLVNWMDVCKLKRPGMHALSSVQALAHGSDSVQYFQWRKSRGSSEKFHGAVVDHDGSEHHRVFREVAALGRDLVPLARVAGSGVDAPVAVIYDWQDRWAIDDIQGLHRHRKHYQETCEAFYRPFRHRGIPVDVIGQDASFEGYRMLVAPMAYLLKPGVAPRMHRFTEEGGTLVCTYLSGYADQNDLCHLGGFPGDGLGTTLGIRAGEIDTLFDHEGNRLLANPEGKTRLGLQDSYGIHTFCEIIQVTTARVMATYGDDFYAGTPVLTCNKVGKGEAWHVAARTGTDFPEDFLGALAAGAGLRCPLALAAPDSPLPGGVEVQTRTDGERSWHFVMNFTPAPAVLALDPAGPARLRDLMAPGLPVPPVLELPPFGWKVLEEGPGT